MTKTPVTLTGEMGSNLEGRSGEAVRQQGRRTVSLRHGVGLFTAVVVLSVMAACTAHSDDASGPVVTTLVLPPVADPADIPTESVGYEDPQPAVQDDTGPPQHESAPDDRHLRAEKVEGGEASPPDETPVADPGVEVAEVSPTNSGTPDPETSTTDSQESPDTVVAGTVPDRRPGPVAMPQSALGGHWLLNNIQVSGSYRPDMSVQVDDGVTKALVAGTVGSRPQVHVLAGNAGQKLEAALVAPPGVSLEVRHGDEVLYAGHDEPRRMEATLAGEGELLLSVGSSVEEPGQYVLSIRIGPPDPEPVVPSSSSTRTASRRRIQPGDVVFLTFDDGPNPTHTPQVLDILARHGARATFFVIGSLVEKFPDIFQRIVSEGHTVANHTWRHENLAGLTKAEFDETISRTEEILGPHATPCLRPPYAATNRHTREWAAEYGLDVHLWSVSANDWLGLNATEIADRIVSQVTGGSVVLMHDGGGNRTQTVRGLDMLLDRLADLDLRYEPLCV